MAPDQRYVPCRGACGEPARHPDTPATCRFRHVPLQGIKAHLAYAPRWVVCKHCGGVHIEAMLWVTGKRRFTRAMMITLASSQIQTWKQVAKLCHCSWSTVEAAAYGMTHRDLSGVAEL